MHAPAAISPRLRVNRRYPCRRAKARLLLTAVDDPRRPPKASRQRVPPAARQLAQHDAATMIGPHKNVEICERDFAGGVAASRAEAFAALIRRSRLLRGDQQARVELSGLPGALDSSIGRAPCGLSKRQRNFAGEPLVAPIKTHLTPELSSNYFFYDARAEPPVCGWRDGWAA
jgi:hypothetical protein